MLADELTEEIEVVQAIYGDDAVRVLDASVPAGEVHLEVDLQPRVEQGAALVSVVLLVRLPVGYPASAIPQVSIERSRGLGDASVGTLLAAACRATDEHGLQEVGCVSQILAEVSEALDVANDTTECNICLGPCGPGESVVHTPCDHVFHGACIGRWAAIKADEAEAAAGEATHSIRATCEGLRRDLEDAERREALADAQTGAARDRLAKCTARADRARARQSGGRQGEEIEADGIEDDFELADGEEPPTLEQLVEQVKIAKTEFQKLQADERRAQGRTQELRRKLESLEVDLAAEVAKRAVTDLHCPVCRVPVALSSLPPFDATKERQASSASDAAVSRLPADLRAQVRKLQSQHQAILEQRQGKEAASASSPTAASASNAVAAELPATSAKAAAAPPPAAPARRVVETAASVDAWAELPASSAKPVASPSSFSPPERQVVRASNGSAVADDREADAWSSWWKSGWDSNWDAGQWSRSNDESKGGWSGRGRGGGSAAVAGSRRGGRWRR